MQRRKEAASGAISICTGCPSLEVGVQLGAPAVGGNEIEILCLIQAGMKSLGYCVLPNSVDKFQPALNQCYYMLLVIMCCTDLYLRRILRGLGTYLCLLFFPKKYIYFFLFH